MASNYIAPLNLPILAAFPPWGGSEGAGRVALAGAKVGKENRLCNDVQSLKNFIAHF